MNVFSKVIAIALFASPFFAQAGSCPDLKGDYNCTVMGLLSLDIPVGQSIDSKGVTTYILDGAPIIADGGEHRATVLPDLLVAYVKDVDYRANCGGTTIAFDGKGKMVRHNDEPGTVKGILTKTGANSATVEVDMESKSSGAKHITATCTK